MALKRRKPIARRRRSPPRKPPPARAPSELERAYATLELEPGADLARVRTAYRGLVARCHPDKWAALGAGPRRMAEEHTREIVRAYEFLAAYLAGS